MTSLQPAPGFAQATAATTTTTATDSGKLVPGDIESALDQLDSLSRLFAAFAERDRNGFASERWRLLSANYAGTAGILRDLLAAKLVVIDDLPAGRTSGLLYDGRIVLDSSLDGVWLGALPQAEGAAALLEAEVVDRLVPALMEGLARGLRSEDWPWLADHLAALGGFDDLAGDTAARPLLARYFRAKDAYLWLAMRRIAEGNPTRRRDLVRRQVDVFRSFRSLHSEMETAFGPAPADRLLHDWSGYVSLVDGFAMTRGWLLLDPTLRLTQLGAAARAEFDAVDLAAAEVMASAPRSAIAAAMANPARLAPQVPQPEAAAPAPVNLAAIIPQREAPAPAELAFDLPLTMLALQPEYSIATAGPAATGNLAARLREALAQPDPRQALAARDRALTAARAELSGLQSQVQELNAALLARETVAPAPSPLPAASPSAGETVPLAGPAGGTLAAPAATQIQPRPLYLILVVAGGLAVLLLIWRGRRRPARAVAAAPLLLAAPGSDTPLVLEPVAATPAAPAAAPPPTLAGAAKPQKSAAPQAPRPTLPPLPPLPPLASQASLPAAPRTRPAEAPLRVSGIAPSTPAAQAAKKAATAQITAQATGQSNRQANGRASGQSAAQGRETDVAQHPIVQALRQGNLPLFELLFSELTGLRSPQLQRIVYGGRGEDLLIVCRALGVDKLLFGSILLLTDHLRGGDANEDPARAAEILRMFDRMPPETAQKVLAKWQRNWSGQQRTRPPAGG